MRQRRWLELLKNCDLDLSYHLGKDNIVADAVSIKSLHMSMLMVRELELIDKFKDTSLVHEKTPNSVKLGILKLVSGILIEIREGQRFDLSFIYCLILINQNTSGNFIIDENGVMRFRDRVCVLDVPELKKSIPEEDHKSGLSIHHSATKMYQDFKRMFWWPGMKEDIVEFVYSCLTFQKSKFEHQKLLGLMQPLNIQSGNGITFL